MENNAFGANYPGTFFETVHENFVTEYYNRETKGNAGPFRVGLSTNLNVTNKWVENISFLKSNSEKQKKQNLTISSAVKEITNIAKIRHYKNVECLKEKVKIDPFDTGKAKNLNTGIEFDQKIIEGLSNAPVIGDNCFKQFVKARLVDKTTNFFSPIKRTNIDTGYQKKGKRNLCFKRRFAHFRHFM